MTPFPFIFALTLALALLGGCARAAEPQTLSPAATEALAAVRGNLESQARVAEVPAQLFQRSEVLWADLQGQMRTLGAAIGDLNPPARLPDAQPALDAVTIDVARAYARGPETVQALLNRYGSPAPGSENKAVQRPPQLIDEDVAPDRASAWLMLLLAPRTNALDFSRPRILQALVRLKAHDALPILELRAVQDVADPQRLPRDLSAMREIDPKLALAIYARCIERSQAALSSQPKARTIYVQEIRNAVGQDTTLAEVARTVARDAADVLSREIFAESMSK